MRVDPADVAQREKSTPLVTYSLIAVNVVLFAACVLQVGVAAITDRALLANSTIMENCVLITGFGGYYLDEYWRLLSSGFLHWGLMHLAVNMFSLYIIGRDLEQVFGPWRYLLIYLTSLLGGSAAVVALEHSETATAGASGAIYGLMGAILVVVLRLKLPATSILAIIGLNIVVSLSLPGISLWAHLGGLLFGALGALALLWLPVVSLPREQRTQAKVSRVGWIGLVTLFIVAVGLGIGYSIALS